MNKRASGFTLVELLVVLAIISLLVALLIPSVNAVRRQARSTASRSVLTTLATGLETYKTEQRLGGAYPPSRSDRGGTGTDALEVNSPYTGASRTDDLEMSGAGLLVWAMAGADLLGTPGFKETNTAPPPGWSEDSHAMYNSASPATSGLYALYPEADSNRANQPVHARSGPYVDVDKIKLTPRRDSGAEPAFYLENETREVLRGYPMFLDGFGYPVLYWRADPAGQALMDSEPRTTGSGPGIGPRRGVFHWSDNARLIVDESGEGGFDGDMRLQTAERHRMRLGDISQPFTTARLPEEGTFASFVWNRKISSKVAPVRPDSYLLVSPGADGAYGTGDDVVNFERGE